MRMDTRCGRKAMLVSQFDRSGRGGKRICNDHHMAHTGIPRSSDDLGTVVVEPFISQVAVRIDQHAWRVLSSSPPWRPKPRCSWRPAHLHRASAAQLPTTAVRR